MTDSPFGKVVNDREVDLENSRINLTVTNDVFERLNSKAEFIGLSVEEYAIQVLLDSLVEHVGKATISGPSFATKKISGPTWKTVKVEENNNAD